MIDGHWVDMGAMIFALLAVAVRLRGAGGQSWANGNMVRQLTVDAFNGAALFPFAVMILAVFSTGAIDAVKDSSRISFGLAGLMGALWVIGELRQ